MAKADIMALMGMNHLAWKRYLEAPLLREGWTLKQVAVLRRLQHAGKLAPSQIAQMLYCVRPTASVVIANLEKRGWVSRETSPSDGRRRVVRLTNRGVAQLQRLPDLRRDGPAVDPLACLDKNERAQLESLLRKVHEHLKTIQPGDDR